MALSFACSVADSSHHVRLYENIIYYTLQSVHDLTCASQNEHFPYYVGILLLLHGLRAVDGLVHPVTAVQRLVNCAVKPRCQRITIGD